MTSLRAVPLALGLACLLALAGCSNDVGSSGNQGYVAGKGVITSVQAADRKKPGEVAGRTLDGKRVSLADFRGKVVVVFFGFTHCPDVCPTTMLEFSQVAKELGPEAAKLQVLFVTVDPERDTPEVLRQYIPSFNPGFLGLYGTVEETSRAAKNFKVYFHKQPQRGGDYTVDHTAGTYVLDPSGRLRLFAQYGAGAQVFLRDIRVLLREAA